MISDKMEKLVAGSSLIRAMFEEGKILAERDGIENVYDFSLGNPNVEPPEAVKKAIIDILSEETPNKVHGYMNNSGFEDVREAIAIHTNQKYHTNVSGKHIVMTVGAAGGLNVIMKTLLNPGEEVITFAPYFTEYGHYVNNYDGNLIVVPANTETFQPDINTLRKVITPKTKAVIINSPNNPTGVIYNRETITRLAEVLNEKQKEYNSTIYLISDEPYRELVYDDIEVPYLLNYYKNTFVGYSYSKSLSLPGERIGYIVVHPEMEAIEATLGGLNVANRILGFVNAPSLFQRVIAKTLGSEVDVSLYKKNRDVLYQHLKKTGFTCLEPQGAFYLFVKTPIEDDRQFCVDAKEYNLLLVPGSAFGCPGYVRIAYCISHQRVQNSLPAFTKLWQRYH